MGWLINRRAPCTHATEFCKQQLWPLLHYLIPLNPTGVNRFDPDLWSAYVRANMVRWWSHAVGVLGDADVALPR